MYPPKQNKGPVVIPHRHDLDLERTPSVTNEDNSLLYNINGCNSCLPCLNQTVCLMDVGKLRAKSVNITIVYDRIPSNAFRTTSDAYR